MKKSASKGLCETCIRKDECTYIRANSEPVHFCEEFTSGCKGNDGFEFRTASENSYEEGYEGLCKNCENRKCCSIFKKGMPVWQCEEYI
ncbi:MAG: hypothetical protein N3B13_03915 [Deltaproteobacteria bacterium]|nr:hypothetical protein [Deltaproteobacteria bacterium]